ncbi:hypothetical protein EHM76_01140, partial [bacterium]
LMFWIIDGHNLIPHVPGISLRDLDDESKLIQWLLDFARIEQDTIAVYFDQAPVGQPSVKKFGRVTAHFVRIGKTADQAIGERVKREGKSARNATVVSSDQQVQRNARSLRAAILSSPEFVQRMIAASQKQSSTEKREPDIPSHEVEEWMNLFNHGKKDKPD